MVLGKLGRYVQKSETKLLLIPHTRINSKWIEDLNIRSKTRKIIEGNTDSKIWDITHSNIFIRYISPDKENKRKNKQIGLHQTKKILYSEGNHQQNKKTTHRIGGHVR